MRLPRYIAVLGERDPFGVKRCLRARIAAAGLAPALSVPGLELFSDGPPPLHLNDGAGVVLGRVYRRDTAMPLFTAASPAESRQIALSRGDHLIEHHWGDYVAFLRADAEGPAETIVLRPPFSDLGCLTAWCSGLHFAASDLGLLELCGAATQAPDWAAIAAHLHTAGLRTGQTCVSGVEEVLGGTRLVANGEASRTEPCWSPWRFAASPRAGSPGELAEELRDLARACVAAQVRGHPRVTVMLSGGLDSSILAACLAAAGSEVACLNLPFGDTAGDERVPARRVAARLGLALHEVEPDIADVDVLRPRASQLARPIARSFLQAAHLAKQRMAAATGASAVLDGGGGDNLFCSLQSVAPVADRLRRQGIGSGALRTACDVARMTEASLPRILPRAISRAWLRSPAYRWRTDDRFLTPEAAQQAGAPVHRWLAPPRRALPGSAAHIALMVVVDSLLETSDGPVPEWAPLMAQPLVEFCLSIPTWHWFENGHNRALARRAFEGQLPREIAWRRGKGSPDGFVARLFEANRAKLGELLVNGMLAEERIIDRDALRTVLASDQPVKGHNYIRLLKLADVEAWVRDRTRAPTPLPPPSVPVAPDA